MTDRPNISSDLIWEIARNNNSYLVKRKAGGRAIYFSRDPLNLTNKHSRTHAGFLNEKAVGVHPGPNGGVVVTSNKLAGGSESSAKSKKGKKKGKKGGAAEGGKNYGPHRPGSSKNSASYGRGVSSRTIYKKIAETTTSNNYRADLREVAVARASAILNSQKPKRDTHEKKTRGSKAKGAEKA